jgi:hypothetical protein
VLYARIGYPTLVDHGFELDEGCSTALEQLMCVGCEEPTQRLKKNRRSLAGVDADRDDHMRSPRALPAVLRRHARRSSAWRVVGKSIDASPMPRLSRWTLPMRSVMEAWRRARTDVGRSRWA